MAAPYVSVIILTEGHAADIVKQLGEQSYTDFEILFANEVGIVNAMNQALKRARGEILVRIDDDVRLPSMWLKALIEPFNDPTVAGVTGPTFVPAHRRKYRDSLRVAECPPGWLRWLWDNDPYAPAKIYRCGSVSYGSNFQEFLNCPTRVFEIDHLEGTNWAMRTKLVRQIGGFDPAFDGVAEWFDTDVEQKIKRLGYRLVYQRDAMLYHLVAQRGHFADRFEVWGRIKNWLRFHFRHSKFHYKKIIWLALFVGYALCMMRRKSR